MKLLNVICARYDSDTERVEVVKEVEMPDGTTSLNLHAFSAETIQARAAEYDTDDVDEVIDMIVHEPFIEAVEYLSLSPDAARNLHRQRRVAMKATITKAAKKLSVEEDKADKKAKLSKAGVHQKYLDAIEDGDYVDVIKRHCVLRPDVVRHYKRSVDAARQARSREQAGGIVSKAAIARDLQRKMEQARVVAQARKQQQRQAEQQTVKKQQSGQIKVSLHKGKQRQ
jgi:hypothetical protein